MNENERSCIGGERSQRYLKHALRTGGAGDQEKLLVIAKLFDRFFHSGATLATGPERSNWIQAKVEVKVKITVKV